MDPDFLRQRRNLLIVSCVLWFFAFAEVKRPPETAQLTAFAVAINLERPHALFVGLWILFGYFFFRYLVYFLEVQERIRETYRRVLASAIEPLILREIARGLGRSDFGFSGQWNSIPTAWQLRKGRTPAGIVLDDKHQTIYLHPARRTVHRIIFFSSLRFALFDKVQTDYLLPIAFALWVAYYASTKEWGGSLNFLLV